MNLRNTLERILHLGGYGCGDTERLLFEFVQEELPPQLRAKLQKHLADCRPCLEYVASYRRTIQATREHALPKMEMPPELQHRLQEFIAQNPQLR